MGQLLHECECGWTDTGDKCVDLCPKCSSMEVVNRIKPNGICINDLRPVRSVFVPACRDMYTDSRCGAWI
jgi:hypothetical protein